MPHSLFTAAGTQSALDRIASLREDQSALWGSMSPALMLQHCRLVNDALLSGHASPKKISLKYRIIKHLILCRIVKLPKSAKQPPFIAAKMAAAPGPDFAGEQTALVNSIHTFAVHTGPIHAIHPVFGPMSRRQWGRFAWIHLDHHLRQFGV